MSTHLRFALEAVLGARLFDRTTRQLVAFGLDRIDADKDIRINLIEATDRILPLLPNGKIDTATLALTQASTPPTVAAAPKTELEAALHGIWSELLSAGSIGRDDNFFDMGGHSLLAMRLVTRIREDLHRHCTVSQVFQHPTLSALAAALTTAGSSYSSSVITLAGKCAMTTVPSFADSKRSTGGAGCAIRSLVRRYLTERSLRGILRRQ